MSDHDFCRTHLRLTMEDVRKVTTAEQRKVAWGYHYRGTQNVEFHGPDQFYWNGRGCCKWSARAKGWNAWLQHRNEEKNSEGSSA